MISGDLTHVRFFSCDITAGAILSLGEKLGASVCSLGPAPSHRKENFLENSLNDGLFRKRAAIVTLLTSDRTATL